MFINSAIESGPNQLYSGAYQAGSIAFSPLGPLQNLGVNAIGYNPVDNYIYEIVAPLTGGPLQVARVDNTGAVTIVGPLTGGSQGNYNGGTFDDAGNYYISRTNGTTIDVVDETTGQVTRTINLSEPMTAFVADLTYSEGYLWGAGVDGGLVRIDPATGQLTRIPDVLPDAPGYGGAFVYGNGDLGFVGNNGITYRVAIDNPTSPSPTASIVSSQSSPSDTINLDATSCPGTPTDLALTKSAFPSDYEAGDQITYTLRVRNNGPASSSGYTVTDAFPAGLTNVTTSTPGCTVTGQNLVCTAGALPVGSTRDITVTATVAAGTTGPLVNDACVRGNEEDPNPGNNCDNDEIEPSTPDVKIKKTGSGTYTPGGPVSFTFVISNSGGATAATYTVTDTIPAGVTITNPPAGCTLSGQTLTCTGTNLAPDEDRTITVNGTVAAGTTGTLLNKVCVTAPGDTNEDNDCDTWPVPPSPQRPDLKIEKTAPATVTPGGQIAYTLTVTNNGPVAAAEYTVTDTIPAGVTITNPPAGCTVTGQSITCTGTNLAVGATRTITLNGTVANNATG
ncbi:hypothetical protein ABZ891_34170, partial [Streptomyces sp. NPDC047023]